jgi:hypothetical protein
MNMKTRITLILIILGMALLVWLTGENRALKQLNKELMEANAMVVDDYFDLQVEYERLFDECLSKK